MQERPFYSIQKKARYRPRLDLAQSVCLLALAKMALRVVVGPLLSWRKEKAG
jgi:hypothetical protein